MPLSVCFLSVLLSGKHFQKKKKKENNVTTLIAIQLKVVKNRTLFAIKPNVQVSGSHTSY